MRTMNGSTKETADTEACIFELSFRIPISILFVATFLLSLSENVLVTIVISIDKKLRRPSNGYLLSLALTDISISIGLIPLEMTYVWSYPKWPLGSTGTNFLNSVWLFSIAGSFITLLVITVDRYRAVMSVVRYRDIASLRRTFVIVGSVWIYDVTIVVLMGLFAFEPITEETYEWNVNFKFYYAFLAMHIVLPLILIRAFYYKIYKKAVENRQQLLSRGQVHPGTATSSDTVTETRLEVKMAKTVAFVFMFLVIVWMPVLILEIFYAIGSQSCVVGQLGVVSVWLTCSNGVINPIVYSLRNKDFHRSMLQLIRCKRPRSASAYRLPH